MMDRTDRHFRFFARQITRHALLYSEMITTDALLKGDAERYLRYNDVEHPVALQLGGSDPGEMGKCAVLAEDSGYDEVNINVGCPSDRVQSGRFGACLMAEPELVAECVSVMQNRVSIPVTVKSRIGIDQRDSYKALQNFIHIIADAGCECFIIHARKAWLKGLNPKQNRTVPPLDYTMVYRLKQDIPGIQVIINGGIRTLDEAARHLQQVDGVMIGRAAYDNPYVLRDIDRRFYHDHRRIPRRDEVLSTMARYLETERHRGTPDRHVMRHLMGLYQGVPGARQWRQALGTTREYNLQTLSTMIPGKN